MASGGNVEPENTLTFAPSVLGMVLLLPMAALGMAAVLVGLRGLVLLDIYGIAATARNNNEVVILFAAIGVLIFIYSLNLILCRITVTKDEIVLNSLLRNKSLRLSDVRQVNGGYLFIRGAPSHYTIATSDDKISINALPFERSQFKAIENRLFEASPFLRSHGRRRMIFP